MDLVNPFRLVYERCRCRRESPEEIIASPYSLLGNLCAAVGATLAGLLHIQVTSLLSSTELLSVSLVVQGPVSAPSSAGVAERLCCCPGCPPFHLLVPPCVSVLEFQIR